MGALDPECLQQGRGVVSLVAGDSGPPESGVRPTPRLSNAVSR